MLAGRGGALCETSHMHLIDDQVLTGQAQRFCALPIEGRFLAGQHACRLRPSGSQAQNLPPLQLLYGFNSLFAISATVLGIVISMSSCIPVRRSDEHAAACSMLDGNSSVARCQPGSGAHVIGPSPQCKSRCSQEQLQSCIHAQIFWWYL